MKFVIIIFVLNVLNQCESSCVVDDEIIDLFWAAQHKNPYYIDPDPHYPKIRFYNGDDLAYFLEYVKLRTKLKNALYLKFPELQCDIEEICNTNVFEINLNKHIRYYSFCQLYFLFEDKKEYIFTIENLELWVFFQRNLSIHSNELINKNNYLYFNTR